MAKSVGSFAELEAILQQAIVDALENEVKQGAIEIGKDHVDTDVYEAYTSPAKNPYERTGELRDSFEGEMLDGNTLEIINTRHDGDRDIVDTIEYGRNYYSSEMDERIGARPFMENTAEELKNGKARELLIKGLTRKLGAGNVF